MTEIPFVNDNQLKIARDIENAVLEFPSSVVEFVGVRVEPLNDEPVYHVTIGCPHSVDPKLIASATFMRLRTQWRTERLDINAFRGITRRHESPLTNT